MKNKVLIIFTLSLLLSQPSLVYAGSAELFLFSANRTINSGDSFYIPIKINPNGTSVDTARVVLNFNPSEVLALSFKLSSNLSTDAPASYIDNAKGLISWGGFDMKNRIESPATFGIATFRAVGEGQTQITLANSSKLISGGEDVANPSSYNKVQITVVPATISGDTTIETIENKNLPPEYSYRFLPNSTLCKPIPSLCNTQLGANLVSIILLIIGIVILVLFVHRKPS